MNDQPNLGLATTAELLSELVARADVHGHHDARQLLVMARCEFDLSHALDYRTTDGIVEDGMISQFRNMDQAEPVRERNANDYQPGGDHYRRGGAFQHWDFVAMSGMDYYAGNATKYISRHRHKNGLQDLEKAIHYIHKARELGLPGANFNAGMLVDFAQANTLTPKEVAAIGYVLQGRWAQAEQAVEEMLKLESGGPQVDHQTC